MSNKRSTNRLQQKKRRKYQRGAVSPIAKRTTESHYEKEIHTSVPADYRPFWHIFVSGRPTGCDWRRDSLSWRG
jgi:hypothetical protein